MKYDETDPSHHTSTLAHFTVLGAANRLVPEIQSIFSPKVLHIHMQSAVDMYIEAAQLVGVLERTLAQSSRQAGWCGKWAVLHGSNQHSKAPANKHSQQETTLPLLIVLFPAFSVTLQSQHVMVSVFQVLCNTSASVKS